MVVLDGRMPATTSGLATVFRILRRRWLAVVSCCLLVPAGALAFSLSQEKQYTGSASLLFRDPGFDQKLFGSQVFEQTDPNREAATNVTLVSLKTVGARAARRLRLTSVEDKVHVKAEGQSNVV